MSEPLIPSDEIHKSLCTKLGVSTEQLSLAQVLEACTWKGGREIAKAKRDGGGRECLIRLLDYLTDDSSGGYRQ